MNLKKAADALEGLVHGGADDLSKLAKASVLLDAFDRENRDVDGSMRRSYADEKIGTVRTYFEILCGVGEDGFSAAAARENLVSSLSSLRKIISRDGLGIASLKSAD